ncbi:hypothetical protein [Paracidovorax wautersii]|uniref:ApeA N-terminal domain-containing protein n=1 Tax=Paracidovorax wautersii TaxID=1177982 RepID=A0ABU1I5Y1_9BURK|nr:hypothetical protein [Paracidovorax wautersii]MDR6212609.1 hypothetical protein [Paracidovorax wautersii]
MIEDHVEFCLGPLDGLGQLFVDRWEGVPPAQVSFTLDARTLRVEAELPTTHAMHARWLNAEEVSFALRACTLRGRASERSAPIEFRLDELVLWDATPEWTKDEDFLKDARFARIVLIPSEHRVVLSGSTAIDPRMPYQVVYQDSGAFHMVMPPLHADGLLDGIHVAQDSAGKMVRFYSVGNFFFQERRLHAAWSLLQGGVMNRVLEVEGSTLRLYGGVAKPCRAHFPMVRRGNEGLAQSVFLGFLSAKAQDFASWYEPLKMYLAGKALPTYVEVSFLMTMACIEALDEVFELNEKTTAALLAVEDDFAKLCNCMRNKLIHGAGGFQQAHTQVIAQDFRGNGAVATEYLNSAGEFDGIRFMSRLWERMDAFWGACVNVPPDVINERRAARVPLGSGVNLQALSTAAEEVRREKKSKKSARG